MDYNALEEDLKELLNLEIEPVTQNLILTQYLQSAWETGDEKYFTQLHYDSDAQLGADAVPICSSMAAVPYLTGKVHLWFRGRCCKDKYGYRPRRY